MTFYFYDLETSSGSPKNGRIMQFAGQRTNELLQPIGEPHNILIMLSDDVLPEPDAILVHKVTPQATLRDGITETAFCTLFQEDIATPNTVFVGYNNIRFDDEFMRRILYRNFHDQYQWHWQDGRSRWDLLDPIRMMRALRPEGMKWPQLNGRPTVKLELLARENGFIHENAHDALSDVQALIQVARQFRLSQPKLFNYLFDVRTKAAVAKLVDTDQPFVYSSGKYSGDFEKTTLVVRLFRHPRREAAIVYDLREDPTKWFKKSPDELAKHWRATSKDDLERPPMKTIQFNKCPSVAPSVVLNEASLKRIKLSLDECERHRKMLLENPTFIETVQQALDILEHEQQTSFLEQPVDNQLYDGFWSSADQTELSVVRATDPEDLSKLLITIKNKRLRELLPLYKARNFPKSLTTEERESWEAYRSKYFYGGGKESVVAKFYRRMQELAQQSLSSEQEYLLTELQLYAESIIPEQTS